MRPSPDTESPEGLLEKERAARSLAEFTLQQKIHELALARQEIGLLKQENLAAALKKEGGMPDIMLNGLVTEGTVLPHDKMLKLWTTLEKIGDNVWEHDFRTGKTYFSQNEFELLGYSPDDL